MTSVATSAHVGAEPKSVVALQDAVQSVRSEQLDMLQVNSSASSSSVTILNRSTNLNIYVKKEKKVSEGEQSIIEVLRHLVKTVVN